MMVDTSDERLELERRNRRLQKQLARVTNKMRTMQLLQDQTSRLLRVLMHELDEERAESERLLLNILPKPIAQRLKEEPGVIAERFDHVSVLFADIVGFTPLSQELSAEAMVEWLNGVYSAFDAFVIDRGVEKIRTIGDNYMVASGVPFPREDHALAITDLALDMIGFIETMQPAGKHKPTFRIGINSGSAVGGVIGTHKFQYDIWGDSVNTAARMESHGQPGRIHISDETHALIKDEFECESHGVIPVKGKGDMQTWFVLGRR